jgi:hypothetical protein
VAAPLSLARQGTKLFGWGLIAFTAPILLAPRLTARLVGITVSDPSTASIMRAVAMRDLVFGAGMISAASHGARLDRWLMMRALMDGGDVLWTTIALLRGSGGWRLAGLDLIALGATVCDVALWRLARAEAHGEAGE